jgi:hypothetical protein
MTGTLALAIGFESSASPRRRLWNCGVGDNAGNQMFRRCAARSSIASASVLRRVGEAGLGQGVGRRPVNSITSDQRSWLPLGRSLGVRRP